MDWEPIQREAFFAFLHRLEQRPVDLLLIEIAREIEKTKRDRHVSLHADRELLVKEIRAEIMAVLARILQEGKNNAFLRAEAAEILGQFKAAAQPVVPALVGALRDDVSFVRVAACQALARIGTAAQSAMESLREVSQDQDPDVRRAAVQALRAIGQP